MNTTSRSIHKSRSARRTSLAVFSLIALALAASPTALAGERGRPGTPGVQQASLNEFFYVLRHLRSVSWSD